MKKEIKVVAKRKMSTEKYFRSFVVPSIVKIDGSRAFDKKEIKKINPVLRKMYKNFKANYEGHGRLYRIELSNGELYECHLVGNTK